MLVTHILVFIAAGLVGLIILALLLRRPEITFALFLFSYIIEGGEVIPGPFDLTAVLLNRFISHPDQAIFGSSFSSSCFSAAPISLQIRRAGL